ncbi:glycosyltransferase [Brevibacterium sp. PAMC21349]|nr:glycosyltransferase [Brevibacterium sp. PAMC21349]
MRILWITNVAIPTISQAMNMPISYGGGWLVGLSEDIVKEENMELCIAFPIDAGKKMQSGKVGNYHYYGIPCDKFSAQYSYELEEQFSEIYRSFRPDVVHIWGTEYTHTFHAVTASEKNKLLDKTVISIQGLVSVYADHYFANIPEKIYRKYTFKELLQRKNLKVEQMHFVERGKFEVIALKKIKHIIGRTDWDRACTYLINPTANYHFCNESLRNSFYLHKWELEKCRKHSIFVSQSQYPIKGLHMILKSAQQVKKFYPDVHIYVTGKDRLTNNKKEKFRFSTYDFYIRKLIKEYELTDNITFLGTLSEEEMCQQYLNANVFVSASSIENSPNSVGEAMLLGVPTVTSDVGGVKTMLQHNVEGLVYPFDEPYMLAYYICEIFKDDEMAKELSRFSRKHAHITHNREKNLKDLFDIYQSLNLVINDKG